MTTPAYFYVGTGASAKNVAIASGDGYPEDVLPSFKNVKSASEFARVARSFNGDWFDEVGPVPWKDASFNFVYAWSHGRIRAFRSGRHSSGQFYKHEIDPKTGDRLTKATATPIARAHKPSGIQRAYAPDNSPEISVKNIALLAGGLVGTYLLYRYATAPR